MACASSEAQTPFWIWHAATNAPRSGEQVVYFRKTFRTPSLLWNARLTLSADDDADVFLNGIAVATCRHWDQPVRSEVSVRLNQGENVLAIRARNRSGPAGLLVHLNLNGQTNVVSDTSWLLSTNNEVGWSSLSFSAAHWQSARVIGPQGMAPWGDVFNRSMATPTDALMVPPGFSVELIRSAQPGEGSWIRLAFDPRGRLIISPEGDQRPLLRLTLHDGQVSGIEAVPAPVRYAMGLLFAYGSLYANARGPDGAGLYRLTDTNANDQFDPNELRLLKKFQGGSEHGYHDLVLGPDGGIYVLNGNGTKLPNGLAATSPHRNYREDVLSLNPDETREATGELAPAGYVARTDPEGKQWELFLGGLRNAYGFDFNPDGELFIFDSDMEWDWGTPWYRPARILHAVSAGEYGWRDNTRLWPDYYEDSLPAAVNVGIGSPTGIKFGTRSRFPEKYRRALFAMDWSYGRIFAVHLEPDGASYRSTVETFLRGTPLNVTDLAFGPDGAMYFVTGGRGTQSGLYRVSYTNELHEKALTLTLSSAEKAATEGRSLRHQLERFHGQSDPGAVNFLWPHLDSRDRFLRYAARIALESQDLSRWKERALAETNATAAFNALLALARVGGSDAQPDLIKAVDHFPLGSLSEQEQLKKLRVVQLSLLRQGRAESALARSLIEDLDRHYPAPGQPLNLELSRLLLYLQAPDGISRTLDLLAAAPTQQEQLHYVNQLRNVRSGWSTVDRRRYLQWWLQPREKLAHPPELAKWFADAGRAYVDGAWVDKYLREFRRDAIAGLSAEERIDLMPLLNTPFQKARLVPVVNRAFVREWTMADLLPDLDRISANRNLERGRQVFAEAQCLACHRFGNDGGAIGPELTAAGSKYDRRSLLESILEPSKVINEQYQNSTVSLKNGDGFSGRIVRDTTEEVIMEVDPLTGTRERFSRAEIDQVTVSRLSPMPDGLVNTHTREEILDLLAYLGSGTTQATQNQ
jgi:putative heme-binding domain-containing protein